MRIVYLGWGSLIWNKFEIDGKWQTDGPKLPVEFARVSVDKRLTLVLYPGAQQVTVLWAYSKTKDLREARCILKNREGTALGKIEYISLENGENNCEIVPEILDKIKKWARTKNIDSVVWTGLPSNFEGKAKMDFTKDNAITYLKSLDNGKKEKAKEYIQKAPSQIKTLVRDKIEKELGWK